MPGGHSVKVLRWSRVYGWAHYAARLSPLLSLLQPHFRHSALACPPRPRACMTALDYNYSFLGSLTTQTYILHAILHVQAT